MSKNKVNTIIYIVLISLLAVAITVFTVLGISKITAFFKPSDLGVRYDEDDIASLDEKLDLEISDPNGVMDKIDTEDGDLGVDYTINYSGYKQKTVILTSSEATALINERMPSLSFFKDSQLKASKNGKVEFSATCDIRQTVNKLFPDKNIVIPSDTPVELPFSGSAKPVEVKNNKLNGTVTSLGTVVSAFLPIEKGQTFSASVENFFSTTPEMVIDDMHITDDGMISITGYLPENAEYAEID